MPITIRALTTGPRAHFFGYYDITPWSGDDARLLCLEAERDDRMPDPGEPAAICAVEQATGELTRLAETRAWNLQQGAMLHWDPRSPNDAILFNDAVDRQTTGVIYNLTTGQRKTIGRPISAVCPTGTRIASVSYGRLARLRKVVGYADANDPYPNEKHPEHDGLFIVDLDTFEPRLIVSIRQMAQHIIPQHPAVAGKDMWFNHAVFNPSGTRLMFLARTRHDDGKLESGLFTVRPDGTDLREVLPFGSRVSHFAWRNDEQLLIWAQWPGDTYQFVLATDDGRTNHDTLTGEWLTQDGHMTFHPRDREVFAIDSYRRDLIVFNIRRSQAEFIRRFPDMFHGNGDLRCDLHPRWNRAGTALCIDAIRVGDGVRQVHVVEGLDIPA